MELLDVQVAHYRSVEDSGAFPVERDVTCLVGKNESGKTAILQALRRLNPLEDVKFVVTEDYPRRYLQKYKERHPKAPIVVRARFSLSADEVGEIEKAFGPGLCPPTHPQEQPKVLVVEVSRDYDNKLYVDIKVDEAAFVQHLVTGIPDLDPRAQEQAKTAKTLKQLQDGLAALTDQGPSIQALVEKVTQHSKQRLSSQVWDTCLKKHFPKFMYFDDYSIMHGAASLDHLTTPAAKADTRLLPLLDLLELADATPQALKEQTNYEEHKARLEGTANYITDEVFEYWKQNQDLEVEFDVRSRGGTKRPLPEGHGHEKQRCGNGVRFGESRPVVF